MRSAAHRVVAVALLLASCATGQSLVSPKLDPFPRRFVYNHNYHVFEVTNGMTVALVPEDKTNLVSVDVRYRVGAAEDPPGKDGLAHFVEHLMFESSGGDGAPTINERLNDVALTFNAYTNFDETHYTATSLRASLAKLLAIEADRMRSACDSIDDARIELERQVVKREIGERASLTENFRSLLNAAVFPLAHPYRRSVIGSAATVDAITRDDVCAFIANHYGPNRALLVVSGNLKLEATQRLVGETFGPIAKRAAGKRTAIDPVVLSGSRSEHQLAVEEPMLVVAFGGAAWGASPFIDQGLLVALLEYRLKRSMGPKLGVASINTGTLGGFRGGASVFLIGLTKDAKPAQVLDAMFKESAALFRSITPLEVEIFKAHFRSAIVERHEPFTRRASNVADYLQYTTEFRFLLRDLDRVQQMSVERLHIEAENFRAERAHVAVIKPSEADASQRSASLQASGKEFDVDSWRVPVDPSEAAQPLSAVIQRPRRRLTRFELANGLKVVLAPDFEYPVVDLRLVVASGRADDPEAKRGTARLAATLLDDNTKLLTTDAQRADYIEILKMGGGVSATAYNDYTLFSVRGLSLFADGLLWQLYFRLSSGDYNSVQLENLQKQAKALDPVLDRDDSAVIRAAIFGASHPYAAGSSAREVLAVSLDDLKRFRDRRFRAADSTLLITGRFEEARMRGRVERLFGAWSGDRIVASKASIPPAVAASRPSVFSIDDSDRIQPLITIAYALSPGIAATQAQRIVVRELLSQRLKSIRTRLGASYGITVTLTQGNGPGLLTVSGEVEPGRAAAAFDAIRSEIASVQRGGEAIASDFVRARRRVVERVLADTANARSAADELETIAAYGLADNHFTRLAVDVAALTLPTVDAYIARELVAEREVVVLRGPKKLTDSMFAAANIRDATPIR